MFKKNHNKNQFRVNHESSIDQMHIGSIEETETHNLKILQEQIAQLDLSIPANKKLLTKLADEIILIRNGIQPSLDWKSYKGKNKR